LSEINPQKEKPDLQGPARLLYALKQGIGAG
jgi:hypothetical protein